MFKKLFPIFLFTSWMITSPVFAMTSNDPFFLDQWYLEKIQAPKAWDTTTGSNDVIVAVLDTGFDFHHPDLAANAWVNQKEIPGDGIDNDGNGYVDDVNGYNFVDKNANPEPDPLQAFDQNAVSHGTVIAGIIGAVSDNAAGIAGINWHVKLMNVRILDNQGVGNSGTAKAGIEYAVKNGAKIINLSFTGVDNDPNLEAAIKAANDAGVLVVAAVGNTVNGGINVDDQPIYPACDGHADPSNGIIGVAATDSTDTKSSFSNYGATCTDISAPGENILSTVYQNDAWAPFVNGYYQDGWSGTSMAAPMVSGAAALLLSDHPTLTPAQLKNVLRLSADPMHVTGPASGKMGAGRLNIANALALADQLYPREAHAGELVKLSCPVNATPTDPCHAVYVYGVDGKRHAFPNQNVFFTWYTDFKNVTVVSSEFMSSLALGKNVTYHPGTKMVKFQTVPTVYAVGAKGLLRPIVSETIAAQLYGENWNKQIDDISDVFFGNYTFGATIQSASDFNVPIAVASVQDASLNF